MKIEVEVISEEIIKPSSPTPHHLRHHRLSFLDQLAYHNYMRYLYFYPHTITQTQISIHLKKSLSKILTHYYPLAGQLKDDSLFIDCNDHGVPFHEARVKQPHSISDLITNPTIEELNCLLPFDPDELTQVVLGVQLNLFKCGGVAIGLCLSHRVADGLSLFTFVKNWASVAAARGNNDDEFVNPDFSAASIFPPQNMEGYKGVFVPNRKDNDIIITKRFVFDGAKIEALRARYQERQRKRSSRVEALSAFLWNRFMAATAKDETDNLSSTTRLYTVVYVMDLRSRFKPPLPHNTFGNYYRAATATATMVDGHGEYGGLVRQVTEEIDNIDNNYMRKFQDGYEEYLNLLKTRMERAAKRELVTLTFSSVCKFPVYEADFGWGKPAWVSMGSLSINRGILFMDTKMGDGIESLFCFKEEDMDKFELDSEFLDLISPIGGNVEQNPFARL